jgi:UDP-N-acetylglucosamine--N-acetylmuramyl-(pentapeptide) pyrophosphoryl-undecaprenol N-acetylglucosamine transferase
MPRVIIAGGGTGGHLMPALAIAAALRELDPSIEPVLVGAERGVEATILPKRPFRYHLLPMEPIYRRAWWRNLRWAPIAVRVWRRCASVLDAEQPALAVGTGGYASGPILLRARLRRIPIALQEQNAYPGITTRWLSRLASQIHLGFPEGRARLRPGRRTSVFTLGNPISPPPDPRPGRVEARAALSIPGGAPVVFVVGGSQGAGSINRALASLLEEGQLGGIAVLWSTGAHAWAKCGRFDAPPLRQVRPFWDPIGEAYAAADLVVGRAGAMTTAELCAWGLPSLLIPLPTAAAAHQERNAEALASAGAAVLLQESDLTPGALREHVEALLGAPDRLDKMARSALARGRPNAARQIAGQLRSLMS